jgi:uncharacterized membrane protein YphA (DoxX/SURF4 family)
MKHKQLISLLLRLGIAISFLYAAVSSLINPNAWISFLPSVIIKSGFAPALLIAFSVWEIILGLWLISRRYIRVAAWFAFATLIIIVGANISAMDIVFRDIPILSSAAALYYLEKT